MKKSCFSLLVPLLVIASLQQACFPIGDAWVRFSGHVKDSEGNPIQGARLKIFFNGESRGDRSETVTNEKGEFTFFENSCPCEFEFLVVAAKDGYKIFSKKMNGNEANTVKQLEIVLVR